MTPEQARVVFDAVGEAGAAIAELGKAALADARGELSDDDLVAVVADYLNAQAKLENARNTQGVISD